jgi:hypothetical protein
MFVSELRQLEIAKETSNTVPRLEKFFTVEDIHCHPVQGPNPKVEWIDMWGDYVPSFFVLQNFSDKWLSH